MAMEVKLGMEIRRWKGRGLGQDCRMCCLLNREEEALWLRLAGEGVGTILSVRVTFPSPLAHRGISHLTEREESVRVECWKVKTEKFLYRNLVLKRAQGTEWEGKQGERTHWTAHRWPGWARDSGRGYPAWTRARGGGDRRW